MPAPRVAIAPVDRTGVGDPPARVPILGLAAGLIGPPAVVGLYAAGLHPLPASILVVAGIAAAMWRVRAEAAPEAARLRAMFGAPLLVVCAVAIVLATAYQIRLAVFMIDPVRAELSVLPGREFFRQHSCLSSYTEAARFAGDLNVYEIERYALVPEPGRFEDRYIDGFVVDVYQYPPAFLLLPWAAGRAGLDFLTIRAGWFALQALLLFAAMTVPARWIGGSPGRLALMLVPFVWLAPTTRLGLQIGNFQLTAFALAMLGMVAFDRGRHLIGALPLGFAIISKIFPGVLGLVLIGTRRWRAVASTAAAGALFTLLAWMAVGSAPFQDFAGYHLPRMQSGEAFPWIEEPPAMPINQSVYGLVTKLRLLGVPMTGQLAASRASSAYAVLVFVLAIVAGLRLRGLSGSALAPDLRRLRQAQVWLALLSLASFRSPFVPDAYGTVGTLWLLTLLAAERRPGPALAVAFAAFATVISVILDGGIVPVPPPLSIVAGTLAVQVAVMSLNVWVVMRPGLRRQRPR